MTMGMILYHFLEGDYVLYIGKITLLPGNDNVGHL